MVIPTRDEANSVEVAVNVHHADIAVVARDSNVVINPAAIVVPAMFVDLDSPHAIASAAFNPCRVPIVAPVTILPHRATVAAAAIDRLGLVLTTAVLAIVALSDLGVLDAVRGASLLFPTARFAIDLLAAATLLSIGAMAGMFLIAASPAALRVGMGGRRNGQRRRTGG